MSLDINLTNVQSTPIVVNANITAENNKVYHVIANATFTDPTPVEGRGFKVFIRNGTAVIGGSMYGGKTLIIRTFHSGAWSNVYYLDYVTLDANFQLRANLSTNVNTDQASNTKYPSVKAVFDWANSAISWIATNGANVLSHLSNTNNPHSTTATQVDALKRDGSNANSDVDLGTYSLNTKSVKVNGTAGAGHLGLKHQSSGATATGSESVIYADSSGNPKWKNDGNAVQNVMLENSAITGATKTKITYDAKGLVTSGTDATTADIADSSNKRYVTDAQLTVLGNTSGTNTGDETQSSILSKLGVFYLPFTPSSIVTGTTSETQVAVVTIPPNSIKSVDNLKIYTPVVKTGTTGLCTVTYKLSTSPTMPSGTTDRIAFVAGTTGSQWIGMNRNPSYNSGNLIIAQTTTSLISDLTTAAQAPSVVAKDNSVTLYLYVSITLGNSSDSAYLSGGYITNN